MLKLKKNYFKILLGFSILISGIPVSAATLNPLCSVTQVSSTSLSFFIPSSTPVGLTTNAIGNTTPSYQSVGSTTACLSLTPPTISQPCSPSIDTIIIPDSIPYYISVFDSLNTYCSYEVTLTSMPAEAIGNLYSIPTPTAVPLLNPLGVLATIIGLLWVGRRSKIILLQKR